MSLNNNFYSFFEFAPIPLLVEDFSEAKQYLENLAERLGEDLKSEILNNPLLLKDLMQLVKVKDVNRAAIDLYKANNKKELIGNLDKVFTKSSFEGFAKLIVDILLGMTETSVETTNKTLEGEEIHISLKIKVMEGHEVDLSGVVISIENITEHVKSKLDLKKSEVKFAGVQSVAKLGNWSYHYELNELNFSRELLNFVGFSVESGNFSKEKFISMLHRDDIELAANFNIEFLLKNPVQEINYRIKQGSGNWRYIFERRICEIQNNRLVRISGYCKDITKKIISEQKLSTTSNLLTSTLTSINDGLVILDHQSKYTYINAKAAQLLGKSSDELIGRNIWDEFPEKKGDKFFDNFNRAVETNQPIAFENYFEPWGKWFENRIIPSKDGLLIFFQEITEKIKKENKIREAYNIINKSSSVAFLCKNERDFPVVFASENCKKLFGHLYSDFLDQKLKIHEIVFPEDLPLIRSEIFKLRASSDSKELKPPPFRIVTKNGVIKWVQSNIDVIRNDKNVITHIQGIVEDISDRKKAEDLLFKSNQRLKDQFNNTPLASIMWDLNLNVLEWNNSAERIFGYTAVEAIGKSAEDLILPKELVPHVNEIRANLLAQTGGYRSTNENLRKNGRVITCEWYNVVLKDASGKPVGMASLVEDISEQLAANKLLEKSEKKYKDIFEKAIDAVFILKNENIVDCNKAAQALFGYSDKEELLEIPPSKISPEMQPDGKNSYQKAKEYIKNALNKGRSRFKWYHKRSNGEIFPAEVSLTRIDDTDGTPTVHAVVRDITTRVKKEKLEKVLYNISRASITSSNFKEFSAFVKTELHNIIDTSNFYIAIYDKESDSIHTPFVIDEMENFDVFPAAGTLTGHVIKTKSSLLVTERTHNQLIKTKIVKLVGIPSKIWVGVPLRIGEHVFGAMVVQSYNDENAYDQSDVQLLEFVANQISILVERKNAEGDLKKALKKAQESDRLKSAFLANMSHEIRTPMNGIIGFSELFLNSDLNEKERTEYAKIVINSSKRLLSIVNDILDISKIEAGVIKLNNESVNINNMIDDLQAFYTPIAAENELELSSHKGLSDVKCTIEIDKIKLNQILTNLLTNAFKFTDEGSVEFGYELKNEMLQFFVKDTGIGIEKGMEQKIFDRFTQANLGFNKKNIGTGLGLAISKKFVELFHGKIWISSNDPGTKVYFTIPYVKGLSEPINLKKTEKKPTIEEATKKVTILIAEDEEYNMLYMNELFSGAKFDVIEASNGKEAVEKAGRYKDIDLILMDIKMPLMNGNEAMQEIKKTRPDLPIIALTAFAMESDKNAAINKGFNSYLTKPIDRKLLFELINNYI